MEMVPWSTDHTAVIVLLLLWLMLLLHLVLLLLSLLLFLRSGGLRGRCRGDMCIEVRQLELVSGRRGLGGAPHGGRERIVVSLLLLGIMLDDPFFLLHGRAEGI